MTTNMMSTPEGDWNALYECLDCGYVLSTACPPNITLAESNALRYTCRRCGTPYGTAGPTRTFNGIITISTGDGRVIRTHSKPSSANGGLKAWLEKPCNSGPPNADRNLSNSFISIWKDKKKQDHIEEIEEEVS